MKSVNQYRLYDLVWHERCRGMECELLDTAESHLSLALRYCHDKRTVIQAGGHIGVWPLWLAKEFQRVITFEPDFDNWASLIVNIKQEKKISCYYAALGARDGHIILKQNFNSTQTHVIENPKPIGISQTTIDNSGILNVDLIVLDLEGYEYQALLGAEQTINRCSPIIMVENQIMKWEHKRDMKPNCKLVEEWLEGHGYQRIDRIDKDVIWSKKNNG